MASRLALVILASLLGGGAHAETAAPKPAAPCDACVFVPAKAKGRPLVVLMHGDNQRATVMAEAFTGIAADRDLALFAPECPANLGCDRQSFWRWNGDPEWLGTMVDDLVKRHELDADRIWILGWSGGATYVGYHMVKLGRRYAATGFLGGGIAGPGGCAKQKPPAYVVGGDKSPYYAMVRGLKNRLSSCKHDVSWKELANHDHDDEWRAFKQPPIQQAVFDFFAAHPRPPAR